jgi:hypothetical protein
MTTLTAGLIAAAIIIAVYFFCIRPMRRGNCTSNSDTAGDVQLDQQVADLREELRVLRAQETLDRGGVSIVKRTPPREG